MNGPLTPENTVNEFFEFFKRGDAEVQVVPITIKEQEDDTRLLLLVKGSHEGASTIFAEVMLRVGELFDLQRQAEAAVEPESRIITR